MRATRERSAHRRRASKSSPRAPARNTARTCRRSTVRRTLVKVPGWISDNISRSARAALPRPRRAPSISWRPASSAGRVLAQRSAVHRLRQLQRRSDADRATGRHQRVLAADRRRGRLGHPGLPQHPSRQDSDSCGGEADHHEHGPGSGAPAAEQGAGLIDALAAVNMALSIHDENGAPTRQAEGLLLSPTSEISVAEPNTYKSFAVTITNTGTSKQYLTPAFETLGPPIAGATTSVNLDPASDPVLLNVTGRCALLYDAQVHRPGRRRASGRVDCLAGDAVDVPRRVFVALRSVGAPSGVFGSARVRAGLRPRRCGEAGPRHLDRGLLYASARCCGFLFGPRPIHLGRRKLRQDRQRASVRTRSGAG